MPVIRKKIKQINEWEKVFSFWPVSVHTTDMKMDMKSGKKVKIEIKYIMALDTFERKLTYAAGKREGVIYRKCKSPLREDIPFSAKILMFLKRFLSVFKLSGITEYYVNSSDYKLEKEKLEKERLEKERLEKERLEKERLEKEQLEKNTKQHPSMIKGNNIGLDIADGKVEKETKVLSAKELSEINR